MSELESFSTEVLQYLTAKYRPAKMPHNVNSELFEECRKFIILHNGFRESGLPDLKGWSFENAIFILLHTDQKIMLYSMALKLNHNQSKIWKLLGVEYFNLCLYSDASFALQIALGQGLNGNQDSTLELLGACLTNNGEIEEGKNIFLKSSRIDYAFIINNYGSIKDYADFAFRRTPSLSRENITLSEISLSRLMQ